MSFCAYIYIYVYIHIALFQLLMCLFSHFVLGGWAAAAATSASALPAAI